MSVGPSKEPVPPTQPLEERPIRWIEIEGQRGWKLKLYAITLSGEGLAEPVMGAVDGALRSIERAPTTGSAGFVMVHQGRDALWLLVALWKGDSLHHTVYRSGPRHAPEFLAVPPAARPRACGRSPVWSHERGAYLAHVLQPRPPRVGRYLAAVKPGADT